MPVSDNATDTQLLQKPPTKTYKPSRLHFDTSAEEEDIMEWIHLEPPMHKTISAVLHNNANKEKEENNNKKEKNNNEENNNKNAMKKIKNLEAKINSLKSENIRLRNVIKRLKYQLRITRKPEKPKKTKTKKKY